MLHKIAWMLGVIAVTLGLYLVFARDLREGFVAIAIGLLTIFLANRTAKSGTKKD
ncbi:hypothetical protein [Aurantiacibacter gangjinensis]|uniref:hypothetical protein n=1 Tax=Aurantiacibacter gangjinensis TaxID=502682 RepID=UPI00090A067F|nr:hypothetical protein [Aurantiacibacter gangjinensis]APE28835.1 hypothetical protein BMF35_a2006 [Aurantiacibacter gangjinensis]